MLASMRPALLLLRIIPLLTPFNLYAASFSVSQSAPPGFEDFSTIQTTRVDIYYGGIQLGSAMATFDIGSFKFFDSNYVASLIAAVNDPAIVAKSLEGTLDPHSEETCPSGQTLGCGVIRPDIAGIIFDESKFRVDLFISPEYLKSAETKVNVFLPPPRNRLSTVSLFRSSFLGGQGIKDTKELTVNTSVAYGRTHLNQRISLDSEHGTEMSNFLLSHTGNKWVHSAGTLRASGLTSSLISNPKLVGIRSAVSLLMHRDRSTFSGSPLIISLDERSRVDLILDNRIVRSAFYQAGNQIIDTSSLPNGSYSIELKISNTRGERIEKRFFTRSAAIPAKGFATHFLEYGHIIEENSVAKIPGATSRQLLNLGSRMRLHNNIGAEFQWLQSNFSQNFVQVGGNFLFAGFNQHIGLLASSNHLLGGSYNFSFLHPNFSLSAAYRHVKNTAVDESDEAILLSSAPGQYGEIAVSGKLLGGSMVANYRRNITTSSDSESYLINYRRAIYRSASMRADFTMGINSRADGQTYSIGVNISKTSKQSITSVALGSRKSSTEGHQSIINTNSSINLYDDSKRALTATAFSALSEINQSLGVGLSGISDWGTASLDVSGNLALKNSPISYAMGLESTLLNSGKTLSLNQSTQNTAGLIVEVNGVSKGKFDVIIDDNVRATVKAGKKVSMLLTPYKNYTVQIRENGEALYQLESPEHSMTLLPGNVVSIRQKAQKVVVLIARAVNTNGEPLANARFTNISEFSTTDESGWFQIELAGEKLLTLKTPDEKTWQIVVPENPDAEDVLVLDDLQGLPQAFENKTIQVVSNSPVENGIDNSNFLNRKPQHDFQKNELDKQDLDSKKSDAQYFHLGKFVEESKPRKLVLSNFTYNSFLLSTEMKVELNLLIKKRKHGSKITLSGHTDAKGTQAYNLALSKHRANSVKAYLKKKGVNASQIDVYGYGENKLLNHGQSAPERAKNRRVEIVWSAN